MSACVDCGKRVGWPLQRCYDCTIDNDERPVDRRATVAEGNLTRERDLFEGLLHEFVAAYNCASETEIDRTFARVRSTLARVEASRAATGGKGAISGERRWIVQLEPGVWWSDGPGDPPRTTVEDNAMRFSSHGYAQIALGCARKFRPFLDAQIVEVES